MPANTDGESARMPLPPRKRKLFSVAHASAYGSRLVSTPALETSNWQTPHEHGSLPPGAQAMEEQKPGRQASASARTATFDQRGRLPTPAPMAPTQGVENALVRRSVIPGKAYPGYGLNKAYQHSLCALNSCSTANVNSSLLDFGPPLAALIRWLTPEFRRFRWQIGFIPFPTRLSGRRAAYFSEVSR